MTHAIHFLSAALKYVPTSICNSQLAEIEAVRKIFANWRALEYLPTKAHTVLPHSAPLIPRQEVAPLRYATPTSKFDQEKQTTITSKGVVQQKLLPIPKNTQAAIKSKGYKEPIAKRNRSSINSANPPTIQATQTLTEPIATRTKYRTLSQKYTTLSHSRALAEKLLTHVANSVLDQETGKQLNYGQLRKHPKFQETWNKSFFK